MPQEYNQDNYQYGPKQKNRYHKCKTSESGFSSNDYCTKSQTWQKTS